MLGFLAAPQQRQTSLSFHSGDASERHHRSAAAAVAVARADDHVSGDAAPG